MDFGRHKQRLKLELAGLVLAMAAFTLVAAVSSHSFSSDAVAQQNIVATLSLRSRPVIDLPQNTYIIKFPIYVLINTLPLSPGANLLAAILIFGVAGFGLFYWAAQLIASGPRETATVTVATLWLAGLGGAFAIALSNPDSRNLEIGLAFAMVAIMLRWYNGAWQLDTKKQKLLTGLFVLAAGLLFYDDGYFMFLFALPLILFFGLKWLLYGRDTKAAWIMAAMAAAIAAATIWRGVFWSLGVHAGREVAVFATLPQAASNLRLLAAGVLDVYNANLFGQAAVSLKTAGLELNFLMLVLTLLSPALLFIKKVRKNTWKAFLVLQPWFVALAFIFSTLPVNSGSERYLVILPFYSVIIFAILIAEVPSRIRNVALVALLLAGVLNAAASVDAYLDRGSYPNAENQAIAKTVEKLHLTKGYANYWDAGINQYFTAGQVFFIPSVCIPGKGIELSRTLINEQEWRRTAGKTFYLYDPNTTRCSPATLSRLYGQPAQARTFANGERLLIYDYDLAKPAHTVAHTPGHAN